MLNPSEHIDELIAAVLANEASIDDIQELNDWIASSIDNKTYFEEIQLIYKNAENDVNNNYNTDEAWNKVNNKINTSKVIPIKPTFNWLKLVAILLITVGIAFTFYKLNNSKEIIIASNDKVVIDSLPDGSSIALNKHSTIEFSASFGTKERRVKLNGEAFFNVIHNDATPFIVDAHGVLIKDIGTEFNIEAYNDSNKVIVMVHEGEVFMYKENGEGIRLIKGERASFDCKNGSILKLESIDLNSSSYKDGILTFNNTPLKDVSFAISKLFGVQINVDKEIEDCLLTVEFKNESIETVMEIVGETMNIKVENTKGIYYFKGANCY